MDKLGRNLPTIPSGGPRHLYGRLVGSVSILLSLRIVLHDLNILISLFIQCHVEWRYILAEERDTLTSASSTQLLVIGGFYGTIPMRYSKCCSST